MIRTKTLQMILCAFFIALTAVFSQISIPMVPVPANLALFAVFCAGGVLGSRYGALSQLGYVLLGAVGVPVFAGMNGGLFRLIGPTGGYLCGYILAAFLVGLLLEKFGESIQVRIGAMLLGEGACLLLGTVWYMFLTGSTLSAALAVCVLPFLPGDAVKIAAAALVIVPIKRLQYRLSPS
ncbi:MAG: biotin transporter BioY [Lachnospiraceae bacterium]